MKKLYSIYHLLWALGSAVFFRFPSREVKVIAVTGTKGKSSTTEIINAIFEEAGYKTALSNTIRFKVDDESLPNMYKMSMPGRFVIQRFLRKAVDAKCDFVIMEMTSQGAIQFRNKYIDLDTFVFTNLSPEHIESHGSYEKYAEAKVSIAHGLTQAGTLIVNKDDKEASRFMTLPAKNKVLFGIESARPFTIHPEGIDLSINGKVVHSPLSGHFNLYNILAAVSVAHNYKISDEIITRAIEKFNGIKGRVEKIEAGQDFTVIVDYAHTADSLEQFYKVFPNTRNICVLGATGGGRDKWKRKEMGKIADTYCDEIILTDDDSYDEDTETICKEIAEGITEHTPTILTNRREAIRTALKNAKKGDAVLITGKGTDPYLMGPRGKKTPWSDATVVKEELAKII